MVKTDEVLRTLLEMGFGCVSLNEAMFRGRGCTDPCIPKSYFATDRLGKHPDAPVNRRCGERVVGLFEIGLAGESRHSACSVSRMLRAAMLELFSADTRDFVLDCDDDPLREGKKAAQLAFLRIAMAACLDGENVGRADVRGQVEAEADRRRAKMGMGASNGRADDSGQAHAVACCRCGECASRPELVESVFGAMDVLSFDGELVLVFRPMGENVRENPFGQVELQPLAG